MKEGIIETAKKYGADIVGFAPSERFEKDSPIFKIMPEVKTVIGLGFRILRGIYRGIEEGTTYFQYTSMAVENMDETVMPLCEMQVAMFLEENGFLAIPQRKHQQIMAESDSTNPEVSYDAVVRNRPQEIQLDFLDTAIKCGLGEKGFHNALLTDEFGPFVRYGFVLTDAVIEPTKEYEPHLCDNCKKCVSACHGGAVGDDGTVDAWKCSVYYNGANGTKNPFMPLSALSDFDDRLEIIAGSAKMDKEKAKKIINELIFYPPIREYQSSICGRACDIACYVHLEEKGVLKKKFKSPFRKREEWKFDIDDFKEK